MSRMIRAAIAAMLAAVCGLPLSLPRVASAHEYEAGQIVVMLQPGHTVDEVNARWGTTTLDAYPDGNLYLLDASALGDVEGLAGQMAGDPAIFEAEANYIQRTAEDIRQMVIVVVGGSYSEFEDQGISSRIGVALAHQITRGAGVTVAVLDTGIDPGHDAFIGRLSSAGYDFVGDDSLPAEEANGIDDDGDGLTDDGYGHGTMVAGIVSLVAPDAAILPVRVMDDEGRGDAFDIAKGIIYAVNHGASVINMSFGVPLDVAILGDVLEVARDRGAVMVGGDGNEALDQAYYPGADENASMVTALDSLDVKAAFADWNARVLVSAPGTGVRSAFPGNHWAIGDGCSFATPFVAGEAALIRSVLPGAIPDEVRSRIASAVDPIYQISGNEPYFGKLGTGRIYLPAAVAGFTTAVGAGGATASASSGAGAASNADRGVALRAWPNPAGGMIHLALSATTDPFTARIYDAAGRLVRALPRSAAPAWDGRDAAARAVEPGVYFIRATTATGRAFTTRIAIAR